MTREEAFRKAEEEIRRRGTGNIHILSAALFLGVGEEDVTPEQRAEAKHANYIWLYSTGPMKMGNCPTLRAGDPSLKDRMNQLFRQGSGVAIDYSKGTQK